MTKQGQLDSVAERKMGDCEHEEIYWYDKDGLGLAAYEQHNADHGRCVKCWDVIPATVSLHWIYCDCERCLEAREKGKRGPVGKEEKR